MNVAASLHPVLLDAARIHQAAFAACAAPASEQAHGLQSVWMWTSAAECRRRVTAGAARTHQEVSYVCVPPGTRQHRPEPAARMLMNAPRAQASVAAGPAKTCPALSAVFARLVSAALRVKKMWTNVPSSLRPAGQAAATTPWVHSTVPVQLASAPEGQGPPAKMWTNVPGAPHLVPMAAVKTRKGASSVSALQASNPTLRAPSARMWMSVRTTWPVLGRSV